MRSSAAVRTPALGMPLEDFPRAPATGTATRADAELGLQLLERAAAFVDSGGDGAVGNPVANANDHALTVMRMIHICKP